MQRWDNKYTIIETSARFRDWSLITGRVKFYPYRKGGGGVTKSSEVVFMRELEVLAILKWGGGAK